MLSFNEKIGSTLLSAIGCAMVGYGTGSWFVGIGLLLSLAVERERLETQIQRGIKLLHNAMHEK